MPAVTTRSDNVTHSGIREIVNLVAERPGADIVRLEIGEPGHSTPDHIVAAAAAASADAHYTPSAGIWPLREALSRRLARVHALDVPATQVIVGQGAVQVIAVTFAATISPGDEVLIPDPAWPNYEMLVRMFGGVPVGYPLPADDGFVPDPDQVAALVTPRTVAMVVNSPGNPTGAVLPVEVTDQLAEVAITNDLLVISDEVYDELIFEGEPARMVAAAPDHVVGVYSFSKTYAMTGFRVGYAAAPTWLAPTLVKLQEPMLSSISEPSQHAALAALEGPQAVIETMRADYASRRTLATDLLAGAGLQVNRPDGAFYAMVPLAAGVDSRQASFDLVDAGVSVAPGTAFGRTASDHVRLSLASTDDVLREGISRLLAWYERTEGGLRRPQ